MRQGHHRLGPADPVEAARGEEVVGDEERVEAEFLGAHREAANLLPMIRVLARQEVRRDEGAELHADALAPTFDSSSPAKIMASRMRSRSDVGIGSSGGRTVSRASRPCITSAALQRAR